MRKVPRPCVRNHTPNRRLSRTRRLSLSSMKHQVNGAKLFKESEAIASRDAPPML